MKRLKKFCAVLMAMVTVLAMGTTVLAADTTDITISGGADGSAYAAYRLMDATDGGEGKVAYTVNETYRTVLTTVTGKTDDKEIIEYIGALDTAGVRAFADAVYAEVAEAGISADAEIAASSAEKVFSDVAQGYYLIVETQTGSDADSYSLVMLDTAGNDSITVTTKEDIPTVTKKVQEKNDSTGDVTGWQDAADYDIGDNVPFRLTGTLPSVYENYKTYYYAFQDTLSAGLTLNEDSIVVKVGESTTLGPSDYTVVLDKETNSFEVQFADLKQISGITKDSVITVEYTAVLNDNAVIGAAGNPNTVKLEYNNDPYYDGNGEPETGTTPEDKVIVFTYEVEVLKTDGTDPLPGAGFTLYKFDAAANDGAGAYVAVGNEITGVTTFEFKGADAGKYKLVETTVPAGYNKADDLYFNVTATYDTESDDPKLTDLSVTVTDADGVEQSDTENVFSVAASTGIATTTVVNQSGSLFPSTGGIGTKIFYTVGAILMVIAAVLLITRKRSAK